MRNGPWAGWFLVQTTTSANSALTLSPIFEQAELLKIAGAGVVASVAGAAVRLLKYQNNAAVYSFMVVGEAGTPQGYSALTCAVDGGLLACKLGASDPFVWYICGGILYGSSAVVAQSCDGQESGRVPVDLDVVPYLP